jgi:hypothetical protein
MSHKMFTRSKKRKMTSNYTIGNYHLSLFPLAMAESITIDTLQNQMTQHGLGTGIYGFIDPSEKNPHTYTYRLDGYELTNFELTNPIVLEKTFIIDGEHYSDLGNFTWLSINLNILCFELNREKKVISQENIEEIFTRNYFFPNENNFYEGIPNFPITLDDIIWVVRSFLHDYNYLQSLDRENESYLMMPINYLAYLYSFDGVINKCDDSGRSGSVKYFFANEHNARGYRPEFKKRDPLAGKLIFMHKL